MSSSRNSKYHPSSSRGRREVFHNSTPNNGKKHISNEKRNSLLYKAFGTTPMPADSVVIYYADVLDKEEIVEILFYKVIYYIGNDRNRMLADMDDLLPGDHIAYRYQTICLIGRGLNGLVLKVYDHKTDEILAMKLMPRDTYMFEDWVQEVRILQHLKNLDDSRMNVIRMYDHFTFRQVICTTFELLSVNLRQILRKNDYRGFRLRVVRKMAISILNCLVGLYRNNIVHGDLKLENILLKTFARTNLKVIDFGCAFYKDEIPYDYLQTRCYRAPEVLFRTRKYDMAIDMWSLGCILCELYTGIPIFEALNSADDYFASIVEILGLPPKDFLQSSRISNRFVGANRMPHYCKTVTLPDGEIAPIGGCTSAGKFRGPPLSRRLSTALQDIGDNLFLDFIMRCLDWNPRTRIKPPEALMHPWIRTKIPKIK